LKYVAVIVALTSMVVDVVAIVLVVGATAAAIAVAALELDVSAAFPFALKSNVIAVVLKAATILAAFDVLLVIAVVA